MKTAFYFSTLTVCALFCAAAQAEDSVTYNSWRDVGYVKTTNWECAQGLCTDGVYYYYAGHNDRTKENADIHKIRVFDNKEVAVFSKKVPCTVPSCSGISHMIPFWDAPAATDANPLSGNWTRTPVTL